MDHGTPRVDEVLQFEGMRSLQQLARSIRVNQPSSQPPSLILYHSGVWPDFSMWSDRIETRLHACSLEVSEPLYNREDAEISHERHRCRQAIVIGCYELRNTNIETSGINVNDTEYKPHRNGELVLYITEKLDGGCGNPSIHFSPAHTIEVDSGVLDGKFHQSMYATASASGLISIYHLFLDQDSAALKLDKVLSFGDTNHGLCLSLGWDAFRAYEYPLNSSSRIISSYSDGSLALHNISFQTPGNLDSLTVSSEEVLRWNAHNIFGKPSEVWSTCFATNRLYNTYDNVIISGADDSKMKLWDIRSTIRPIHDISSTGSGVTAVSFHPLLEHVFASGSYDESISIWDMRKLDTKYPIQKIENIGGGCWRLKWHPHDASRILVAAMHGGGLILDIESLQDAAPNGNKTNSPPTSFTAHQSMTYGADWIYCAACGVEAAATCSFYDRQAFIWSAMYAQQSTRFASR